MSTERIESLRSWYADEVAWASGVSQPAIRLAFARVPREDFLPTGPWLFSTAMIPEQFRQTSDAQPHHLYHNVIVAIDPSRDLSSALPSYMAAVIDFAGLKPGSRVAHLGAGLGYYSAIMAEIVGATGSVVALEIDPTLASQATVNLQSYAAVACLCADGTSHQFLPRSLDALVVSAGASCFQSSWLASLRDGGRLIVPLSFSDSEAGQVTRVTRRKDRFRVEFLLDTVAYPCHGSSDTHHANLLRQAVETYGWYSDAELRLDVENADESAWIVTPTYWISMVDFDVDSGEAGGFQEIVSAR